MSQVRIPEGVIGRPGLLAMLQRVGPASNGRLVVIRHAVGPMSSLGASPRRVFAWQALVLGQPIDVHGKLSRDIVVADPCLKPVSQIDPAEVEKLVRSQVQEDFDAALADLHRILEKHPMSEEALDAAVNGAADMFGISRALEVVPTATALRELGFIPTQPDSETILHWSGLYQGLELYVTAGPDMFGNWTLTGGSSNSREKMWNERVILGNEPRGKLGKYVLDLWRETFGNDAPPPTNVDLGLIYEQHLHDFQSLDIGLPRLHLDGEVFRATRTWLAKRHPRVSQGDQINLDQKLSLSFADGLLRLQSGCELFACPGWGVWVGDCEVSLGAFIDTPPTCLRGRSMVLERQLREITINGYSLPLLSIDDAAS